jgi:hypothetical protein
MSQKQRNKRTQQMQHGRSPKPFPKARTWTAPAVLGLILAVVGALSVIELRPQISVSPQGQLATGEPFSAPFEISSTGFFPVHIDNVTVIMHRMEHSRQVWNDDVISNADWDNFDLERNSGTKTIFLNFANGQPDKADLVVAVDYRFMTFKMPRWFFRFEGVHRDTWEWTKQPMGNLDLGKLVDDQLEGNRKAMKTSK